MLTPAQQSFLRSAVAYAREVETKFGWPAPVTVGQSILETGWGAHAPGNNYFGLGENGRGNGVELLPSQQYENGKLVNVYQAFETYVSPIACFLDYGWLMAKSGEYAKPWEQYQVSKNSEQLIDQLAPIYAPGDLAYAPTVWAIIESSVVQAALKG